MCISGEERERETVRVGDSERMRKNDAESEKKRDRETGGERQTSHSAAHILTADSISAGCASALAGFRDDICHRHLTEQLPELHHSTVLVHEP